MASALTMLGRVAKLDRNPLSPIMAKVNVVFATYYSKVKLWLNLGNQDGVLKPKIFARFKFMLH